MHQIFKDKNGSYSLREIATALLLLALLAGWMAAQFFYYPMPEYIFYGFSTMVAAGCFGYSYERKSN